MPVDPEFSSLNLAQCVLLIAYEWRRAREEGGVPGQGQMAADAPARGAEIEALAAHYEARLTEAGFFFPPEKAAGMKTNLRNMWSRMPLTRTDVRILHGILRQLLRHTRRGE